jgi:hypothetical protein
LSKFAKGEANVADHTVIRCAKLERDRRGQRAGPEASTRPR